MHSEWISKIQDDWPPVWEVIDAANAVYMRQTKKNLRRPREEVGSDMGAFLCFMAVRLLEMRRVLKSRGSIYLHCDPTASHYLKALMDAIFGWKMFRNEIVWAYGLGGSSHRYYSQKHDIILFYSKTKHYYFDKPSVPATSNRMKGQTKGATDVWTGFPSLNNMAKERTGFPTQKPLDLYSRIVAASSREGDVVCDPFAGCATTLVAAERLGRAWVGIDIWHKAKQVVMDRLQQEGLATASGGTGLLLWKDITFTADEPQRTDEGHDAVPFLRPKLRLHEPRGPYMSKPKMREFLLDQHGARCQGCDRSFDDPRYLELDHNTPRSDGGLNHISNRVLLCGPCNRLKSNQYTLSGLRRINKKHGYMTRH